LKASLISPILLRKSSVRRPRNGYKKMIAGTERFQTGDQDKI
jgi:hypothetical protein